MVTMTGPAPLLSVRGLRTEFRSGGGSFAAVDDVSFDLAPGEVLGIVGESGSGKSVTALSILRLVPDPPGRITAGQVLFEGKDLLALPDAEMRALRGNRISMIFQEPMSALNPVFTVGEQIAETLRRHEGLDRKTAAARAVALLDRVHIPAAAQRAGEYPHQLSGGMRQRVMIAMALACRPTLLIADEPTTALDVTIQAQILDLLRALQAEMGMSVILITHDLGVVAEFVDRVIVMYGGRVAEEAPVAAIYDDPLHPYTEGLLASIPSLDSEREMLEAIEGVVPSPLMMPAGCRFHPRCRYAEAPCVAAPPPLIPVDAARRVACLRYAPGRPVPGPIRAAATGAARSGLPQPGLLQPGEVAR